MIRDERSAERLGRRGRIAARVLVRRRLGQRMSVAVAPFADGLSDALEQNERLRVLVDAIHGTALGGLDFPREALEEIVRMSEEKP